MPSIEPSSLPYIESYFEATGYALDDMVFFKIGYGQNKEVLKTNRFFEGTQMDINQAFNLDTTYNEFDIYAQLVDVSEYSRDVVESPLLSPEYIHRIEERRQHDPIFYDIVSNISYNYSSVFVPLFYR